MDLMLNTEMSDISNHHEVMRQEEENQEDSAEQRREQGTVRELQGWREDASEEDHRLPWWAQIGNHSHRQIHNS